MSPEDTSGTTSIEVDPTIGVEIRTQQILAELDAPVRGWNDSAPGIQAMFVQLCDPILDALSKDHGTIEAIPGYPVIQNLVRAFNHVLAGFHLAQHGFLNQANGTLRTSLEACDLAQLCALQPDQAKLWVESKQPHVDFSPSKVRKLLGKPRYDEMHGWLSETGTHSRSVGAALMGYRIQAVDEAGKPHQTVPGIARLKIGPNPDQGGVAFGCLMSVHAAVQIGMSLGMLAMVSPAYSEHDWVATLREIDASRGPVIEKIQAELVVAGVTDAETLVPNLSDLGALIDDYELKIPTST